MITTFLVTSGCVMMPYYYVVVERDNRIRSIHRVREQKVSRFPLTAQVARAELFKGVAIPSPLAERQLTQSINSKG